MNQLLKDYPGRIIIIGITNDENVFALYAITGRSSSSQARKMILNKNEKTIFVIPTNESEMQKGNRELLIYPSMWWGNGIVVSNGKQTESLMESAKQNHSPREVSENGLKDWTYEPDAPHFTPRISAYINSDGDECVTSIIKRNETGKEEINFFDISLVAGKSYYISTYNGENTNPLPSFVGEPKEINLLSLTPNNLCAEVFALLGEKYRVAVACVMMNIKTINFETFVMNKNS